MSRLLQLDKLCIYFQAALFSALQLFKSTFQSEHRAFTITQGIETGHKSRHAAVCWLTPKRRAAENSACFSRPPFPSESVSWPGITWTLSTFGATLVCGQSQRGRHTEHRPDCPSFHPGQSDKITKNIVWALKRLQPRQNNNAISHFTWNETPSHSRPASLDTSTTPSNIMTFLVGDRRGIWPLQICQRISQELETCVIMPLLATCLRLKSMTAPPRTARSWINLIRFGLDDAGNALAIIVLVLASTRITTTVVSDRTTTANLPLVLVLAILVHDCQSKYRPPRLS